MKNAKVLVLENIPHYDCIMGRDLINRIPRLSIASLELRSIVESCAQDLLANLDEIVFIFPEFKDNQPAILVKQKIPET